MKWQPIETAPKDRTTVLVYEPSHPSSLIDDGFVDAAYFNGAVWQSGFGYPEPTHWMPLPEPPKENDDA